MTPADIREATRYIVRRSPGLLSVGEIASQIPDVDGFDRTHLHNIVRSALSPLIRTGEIIRDGRGRRAQFGKHDALERTLALRRIQRGPWIGEIRP